MIKKYWTAFAVIAILTLIAIYWFYFRKKKTKTTAKATGIGSSKSSIIAEDGIEMGTIVYDSGIAGVTFNHGGRTSSANITQSINLNNIALKDGYSYSIEQYASTGEESTEIKLFLNGELKDWISIDWVIGKYARIPVENYSPGGGLKDEQEQAESNTGKELVARYVYR
ncbi:MAG: hypothetical protein MK212_11965 [Saprospiraceae bacterium]|nr:hypothetical protein [Saprospiraceae bacterium]